MSSNNPNNEKDSILRPVDCRMARAALHWKQIELARAADTAPQTIVDFERGTRRPHKHTLRALRQTFEAHGVTFQADGGVVPPAKGN